MPKVIDAWNDCVYDNPVIKRDRHQGPKIDWYTYRMIIDGVQYRIRPLNQELSEFEMIDPLGEYVNQTVVNKLEMCENSLHAVRNLLLHVEGAGKGGAIRWTEVIQQYLTEIVKEIKGSV